MTQNEIAKLVGVSKGHLSMILTGSYRDGMGKATAKKIAHHVSLPWNEIIAMDHHQLRKLLDEAFSEGEGQSEG